MDDNIMGAEVQDKLVVLYVLDKMELPLAEDTILSICSTANEWIAYINCKHVLDLLSDVGLVHRNLSNNKVIYTITPEGRACLANFYTKIPLSRRDEITDFIRKQRIAYKKKQELFCDYYKNNDGTYTVRAKIFELGATNPMMDLSINVDSRASAKYLYNTWEEKAAKIYELLYDNLFD